MVYYYRVSYCYQYHEYLLLHIVRSAVTIIATIIVLTMIMIILASTTTIVTTIAAIDRKFPVKG